MKTLPVAIAITLLFILSMLFLFRYEIVPASYGGSGVGMIACYRLDRWTGKLSFVRGPTMEPVHDATPFAEFKGTGQ